MSAATTVKHESPVVENVSEFELLPSMQVVCGGEGYIDFKTGKIPNLIFLRGFLATVCLVRCRRFESQIDLTVVLLLFFFVVGSTRRPFSFNACAPKLSFRSYVILV